MRWWKSSEGDDGGSLEWRSIAEGRIKSMAGRTLTDILID